MTPLLPTNTAYCNTSGDLWCFPDVLICPWRINFLFIPADRLAPPATSIVGSSQSNPSPGAGRLYFLKTCRNTSPPRHPGLGWAYHTGNDNFRACHQVVISADLEVQRSGVASTGVAERDDIEDLAGANQAMVRFIMQQEPHGRCHCWAVSLAWAHLTTGGRPSGNPQQYEWPLS